MPSPDGHPYPGEWVLRPAFDQDSQFGNACSMTGLPMLSGDTHVVRGAHIEFEGYFDIGMASARQLAELIGYVPGDRAEKDADTIARLQNEVEELSRMLDAEHAMNEAINERADGLKAALDRVASERQQLLDERETLLTESGS